jgi:hypothetical protein
VFLKQQNKKEDELWNLFLQSSFWMQTQKCRRTFYRVSLLLKWRPSLLWLKGAEVEGATFHDGGTDKIRQ